MSYVHNLGVVGRFYGEDLKKEMVVLQNKPWRSLDQLMIKKTTADSKSEGKNMRYTCDLWPTAVRERLLELFCG